MVEQLEEELIDIEKTSLKQTVIGDFKSQLKELFTKKYLTFIFNPKSKNRELDEKEFEFNKLKSRRNFLKRLKYPLTILGIIIIIIILSWAVFAPWISQYTAQQLIDADQSIGTFSPPSDIHPLGTAQLGHDVLGRLIFGARYSLLLGLIAVLISLFFGIIFGIFAAYYGGIIDNIIMRTSDVVLAFPSLILTIIIIAIFGRELTNIMLIYGFLGIPGYARLMRGAALQEKSKIYVSAAKISGASSFRIMFSHIFKNAFTPILISFTFDIGGIILSLAGLSFLGFGQSSLIEWGIDIATNKSQLLHAPWAALWPGFGITITVLGFMLVGDGLRDAFDPRINNE